VKKGDFIGTVTLRYADKELQTIDLVAAETVERSDFATVISKGEDVLTSPWFKIITLVVVALVVLYIVMLVVYNVKRSRIKARRRHHR
ncbi:MAG: D-alanyl-D-alanine carboxypeptidase, partial [Clostridia bacterium]|nr:D-alanyl-D-alanine carboxypeptidase [Clostridia bacterium]